MDGNYFVLAVEAYVHRYYYSLPLWGVKVVVNGLKGRDKGGLGKRNFHLPFSM